MRTVFLIPGGTWKMALKEEIDARRKEISTDSYPMSIGELANLYRDGEIDIHPEWQRFYRWTPEQKTKLIESILLGIPIPSIFVAQRKDGVWDVIDGLQRLSTIFQTMGLLCDEHGTQVAPLTLGPTEYLPSLEGMRWDNPPDEAHELSQEQKLLIKRSKIDLKIILRESDPEAKYELFQRLNTGGTPLVPQEVRNCILIMVNRDFYQWVETLAQDADFRACTPLTDRALDEQYHVELVVRFIVFRRRSEEKLKSIGDLSDFLTKEAVRFARDGSYDRHSEEQAFEWTFRALADATGEDSFRRFDHDKSRFSGGFLISAFEAVALGLGYHWSAGDAAPPPTGIQGRVEGLWSDQRFLSGMGAGVRASSRIPVVIPVGREVFRA